MNEERAVDEFHETYNIISARQIYYNNIIIPSYCRRWPILITFELIENFNIVFTVLFRTGQL